MREVRIKHERRVWVLDLQWIITLTLIRNFSKARTRIKLQTNYLNYVLGSDPTWALSDAKLVNKVLWLARRRAVSKQESKIEQEEIL
jgi:hypothetical protein